MRLALALLLALGIAQAMPAHAQDVQPPAAGQAAQPLDRRILVMLKLPPEHYRPGADYGGSAYGDATSATARRRMAARLARENGFVLGENWAMPILGIDCVVMFVPGEMTLESAAARMSQQPGVAWSQPMQNFSAQGVSAKPMNDRLFLAQPSAASWQLASLHRMSTGRGVKIAIVDSMIDSQHPDLAGQLLVNLDMTEPPADGPEVHGTGIAGIVAAHANNDVGIAGIAPGAQLMGLRACWQHGAKGTVCDSLSLARALTYAIENKAGIVNLSLSGPSDRLIARLIAVGQARGTSFVAAIDPRTGDGFPASLPGVVAVASDGSKVQRDGIYLAPGRDIPTTGPGGRWVLVTGNSFAAAHVTGLLALMRELGSTTPDTLIVKGEHGGKIEACRSLASMARRSAVACHD